MDFDGLTTSFSIVEIQDFNHRTFQRCDNECVPIDKIDTTNKVTIEFNSLCLCESCVSRALGSGISGTVFRIQEFANRVIKRFTNADDYFHEKSIVQQIYSRISTVSQEWLISKLCLPIHYCDAHCSLIMPELDPSCDLEAIINGNSKSLSLTEAYEISNNICHILHCLHRCGIIHGDLKAKNINITCNGPVVFDFGYSQIVPYSSSDEKLTTLIASDSIQLMRIFIQLRFRLPYLTKYDGIKSSISVIEPGLMSYICSNDGSDEDESWDYSPSIYTLAGLQFDALMFASEQTSEDNISYIFNTENIKYVLNELFYGQDSPLLGPTQICGFHMEQWSKIVGCCHTLDQGHRNLKHSLSKVANLVVHSKMIDLRWHQLRSIVDQVLAYNMTRIRFLFNLNTKKFDDCLCALEKHIVQSYQNIVAALDQLTDGIEVDEFPHTAHNLLSITVCTIRNLVTELLGSDKLEEINPKDCIYSMLL